MKNNIFYNFKGSKNQFDEVFILAKSNSKYTFMATFGVLEEGEGFRLMKLL